MTSTGPFKQTLSDSNNNYLKIIIIIIMCYLQTNRKDLPSLKFETFLKGTFWELWNYESLQKQRRKISGYHIE